MHALMHEPSASAGRIPLRATARSFLPALFGLTLLLLGREIWRRQPVLEAARLDLARLAPIFLLTLPFILALTLPAALLVSTAYGYSRPGARDAAAQGLIRQLRPTLLGALGLAILTYLLANFVVPRTNAELRERFLALQMHGANAAEARIKGDREMTIAEMAAVVRESEAQVVTAGAALDLVTMDAEAGRAAQYRVEIEKKRAIAVACVVFALAGAGLGLRLAGRPWWLATGAGTALFGLYFVGLIVGEQLGDARLLSPVVAMWGGNAAMAILGLVLLRRESRSPGSAVAP